MRESERPESGNEDGGERPREDLPQPQDTITAAPEPDSASPPPGAVPEPDEAPKRRPGRHLFALIALTVAGLAALGGGVFGLVWAFSRVPDPAQVTAVANAESARQWRWLPAGKIFPATIGYQTAFSTQTRATRVGIAPQEPCAQAFDGSLARLLDKQGCVTVLRATYADASRTVLDTVGIAVMKSEAAANAVDAKIMPSAPPGLLPLSFPGTIAAAFTRRAREQVSEHAEGRYLFFSAAGYADGRKTAVTGPSELSPSASRETTVDDLASSVAGAVAGPFSESSTPCADPEVRCSP